VEFEREFHPDEYWTYDPEQYGYLGDTYSLPMGGFPYWDYPIFTQSAPAIFPTVRVIEEGVREGVLPPEDIGDEAVVSPAEAPAAQGDTGATGGNGVLGEFPEGSIFAPGEIWGDRPETDWGKVYDDYVILNPPVAQETQVADWGDIFGTALGSVAESFMTQPVGFGGTYGGGTSVALPPPTKVTVDTRTGKVTACRRRRRRRLVTAGDLQDIAALKAIIGGGSALNAAVVKAIR